jgi:hypothetical protein
MWLVMRVWIAAEEGAGEEGRSAMLGQARGGGNCDSGSEDSEDPRLRDCCEVYRRPFQPVLCGLLDLDLHCSRRDHYHGECWSMSLDIHGIGLLQHPKSMARWLAVQICFWKDLALQSRQIVLSSIIKREIAFLWAS